MTFKNTAVERTLREDHEGDYRFTYAPNLLYIWSRLFQSVISQAGTYLLTGKFHTGGCAIYKCEGGCKIHGVGDLVLGPRSCYLDFGGWDKKDKKRIAQLAELISYIVLLWDPNDPIESMLKLAAEQVDVDKEALRKSIFDSSNGGVFGGDSLSHFFDHNPFGKFPIDRDYLRYCLETFEKMTKEQVDQQFADEDLGEDLLKRLKEKCKSNQANRYSSVMCCAPRRKEDGTLEFWVNTGSTTQIDYWKTQEELEAFLKTDGLLIKK